MSNKNFRAEMGDVVSSYQRLRHPTYFVESPSKKARCEWTPPPDCPPIPKWSLLLHDDLYKSELETQEKLALMYSTQLNVQSVVDAKLSAGGANSNSSNLEKQRGLKAMAANKSR